MNNTRQVNIIFLFLVTLFCANIKTLISTPNKGSISINSPATTINQQITFSALNSSQDATLGQFKILESGYYFLSTDLQANPGVEGLAVIYINASDVVLDLGNRSITVDTNSSIPNQFGIQLASGINNVTIMNGTINCQGTLTSIETGIFCSNNTNVTLENVQIINSSASGISLDTIKGIYLKTIHVYGSGSIGINFLSCADGVITNSSFSGSSTQITTNNVFGFGANNSRNFVIDNVTASNNSCISGSAIGMYFNSCTGFTCSSINAGSNTASGSGSSSAIGMYLSSCTGFTCNEISANCNTVTDKGLLCTGIQLSNSTGCSFKKSIASNNQGKNTTTTTIGFSISANSTGNSLNECEAQNNIGGKIAAGIYISASTNTRVQKCISSSNYSPTSVAYGILASGIGTHNTIRECTANANYSLTGAAYGIAFDRESRSTIEYCEASSNDGGSGTAYGIALANTCTKIVVGFNTMFDNFATTSRYGFKDFATNSTTLLRGNTAFGHGKTFSSGSSATLTDSGTMNYMLTYAAGGDQMNIQYLIKESDVGNLNSFESNSTNWFNFSIE